MEEENLEPLQKVVLEEDSLESMSNAVKEKLHSINDSDQIEVLNQPNQKETNKQAPATYNHHSQDNQHSQDEPEEQSNLSNFRTKFKQK